MDFLIRDDSGSNDLAANAPLARANTTLDRCRTGDEWMSLFGDRALGNNALGRLTTAS